MALPYLQTLNATARIAYPFIQRGVRSGLSGNAIGRLLETEGLGIRRATLLDIVKREKAIWQHGLNLRYLPLNRAPNPDKLPEALTKLRRNYSYRFLVTGTLADTGELVTQHYTVASSKIITRGEAQANLETMLADDPARYPMEVQKIVLDNVLKAGELGAYL